MGKEVGKVYEDNGFYYVVVDNNDPPKWNTKLTYTLESPDGETHSGSVELTSYIRDISKELTTLCKKWGAIEKTKVLGLGDLSTLEKGVKYPIGMDNDA
jgi:hypothetical protein